MSSLGKVRPLETMQGAWLPIRLTALLLILNTVSVWYLSALMIALVGLGLLYHSVLRVPVIWAAISLVLTAWIVRLWPMSDNHQYLAVYWSLSILIALCLVDPDRSLAISARWLLAFVFVWAVLWKGFLSSDYMDGRFFSVRLMTDARFEEHAQLLSGLTLAEVRQNRAYLDPHSVEEEGVIRASAFKTTPRFKFWVRALTWGVLLAEAGVALAFLLPWGRWTPIVRHGVLMGFSLGTFTFAPVPVFGWLLVTMGLAQVDPRSRSIRTAYVIVWFLIGLVYQFPWEHFISILRV